MAQGETMRSVIEQYQADFRTIDRLYDVALSPARTSALRSVLAMWKNRLAGIDFGALEYEDQIDYLLLRHRVGDEEIILDRDDKDRAEVAPLMPFTPPLVELIEARQKVAPIDSRRIAETLTSATDAIKKLEAAHNGSHPSPSAGKAGRALSNLQRALADWFTFYNGYDPLFTWWVATPYHELDQVLRDYAATISPNAPGNGGGSNGAARGRGRNGGAGNGAPGNGNGGGPPQAPPQTRPAAPSSASTPITGIPVGREALMEELHREMIPYTPEELIAAANQEFEWCDVEIKKASREMGFGDDWKKALEKVKNSYLQPGEQPQMIQKLAVEAVEFVKAKKLVTIPPLAEETWRADMMTPERQLVNPFFTGGDTISISFPTDTMAEDQKLMSLRGNNIYFCRATVFHELIPGHYLQQFMTARYRPYRSLFGTPFWIEGGALYWEMTFYDIGFPRTPEEKIGMLFWRMHRCARVLFSLRFHLGEMSPQQCVDFLVDRVGHERANAEGEVRRSFAGGYSTLYQAAYLIGGMQIRALRRELVDSGKMTELQFHDAIYHEGDIPIEMLRVALTKPKLTPDYDPTKDPAHLVLKP